jgi:type IV secretory pathway TrbD component
MAGAGPRSLSRETGRAMEMAFKILVTATCLAVWAALGWWGWGEWTIRAEAAHDAWVQDVYADHLEMKAAEEEGAR